MDDNSHLFGLSGAEYMYDSAARAYEAEIDGYAEGEERLEWIIEEYSVVPAISHIPSSEAILEWIGEQAQEEMVEAVADDLDRVLGDSGIVNFTESLRFLIASHMTGRMANEKIAEHTLSWDDETPLLDGEPLYVKAENA